MTKPTKPELLDMALACYDERCIAAGLAPKVAAKPKCRVSIFNPRVFVRLIDHAGGQFWLAAFDRQGKFLFEFDLADSGKIKE